MLDNAITLLTQTQLRKLIAQYLNPAELRPDGARKEYLLADVKAFRKVGRNSPSPCSSGTKYKKCCLGMPESPVS
jgi:uncharacterized protein YecA (UPF0149 family)